MPLLGRRWGARASVDSVRCALAGDSRTNFRRGTLRLPGRPGQSSLNPGTARALPSASCALSPLCAARRFGDLPDLKLARLNCAMDCGLRHFELFRQPAGGIRAVDPVALDCLARLAFEPFSCHCCFPTPSAAVLVEDLSRRFPGQKFKDKVVGAGAGERSVAKFGA